jgi:hypothetical protein
MFLGCLANLGSIASTHYSKRLWFKIIVQKHDPSMVLERNVSISIFFCHVSKVQHSYSFEICFLHVSTMFHIILLQASYMFLSMFLSCFSHVLFSSFV